LGSRAIRVEQNFRNRIFSARPSPAVQKRRLSRIAKGR
jgi:hypothetical protein